MKKPHAAEIQLVAALAKHLLSPSRQFENTVELGRVAMRDSLRCLSSLDKATRLSLPLVPATQATPHAAQPPMPTPQPVRFDSARPEYQGALRDPSIIEALLKYRTENKAAHATKHATTFRSAPTPLVDARPKPAARSRIFRPK